MRSLLSDVQQGRTLVADGAIGTWLMDKGYAAGRCPEEANLKHPQLLEEIAALYLDAGADIIQTNTFGASPLKLAAYELEDVADHINHGAVQAVRRVVGERAYVSGTCGPSGRILLPYGDADPKEVGHSFFMQIESLITAGVDCICIETMTDLEEAKLAVRAAREISKTIPVLASMTFDATPKGFYSIMGTSIEQAAEGLHQAGADVIGSNCGNGIDNMIKIAAQFKLHSDFPLTIQSNAGLPEMHGDRIVYPETPSFMASRIRDLVTAGASIVGGCCGTTPQHIRAFREAVDLVVE